MKKIISLFLVICMLFAFCATEISALNYVIFPLEGYYPYVDYKKIENTWYYSGVKYLNANGLINCFNQSFLNDHDFYPNKAVSRKQAANFIYGYDWNYFGGKLNENGRWVSVGDYKSTVYKDISSGEFAYAADWCYDKGIMNGFCKGYFIPDVALTREEFVTVLYRYTLYKEINVEASLDVASSFSDYGKVSPWARDAIDWACETGLMNGKTKTTLNPKDKVTRAELSMIAVRYDKLVLAHEDNWDGK